MQNCKHPRLLCLIITLGGILIDQLTKLIVATRMDLYESIPIIRDALHITYIHNRGAAFGMLADNRWIFIVVSLITIAVIIGYLLLSKTRDTLTVVSLSMILSGGIGNMIDRLALGYVVDFIDFCLIDFAIFNGADSFVCVGAALFFLAVLLEARREQLAERAKKAAAVAEAEQSEPTEATEVEVTEDTPSDGSVAEPTEDTCHDA